jgi:glycosyltransferase involved in cell wall biosynthesis
MRVYILRLSMVIKMNILQVIAYFTPQKGGDVNVCYNLSKQLARRGNEVTIVTTDYELDKEFVASIEKEGVKVIPFHCIADICAFLVTPSIKRWLKLNINKYDIIHMHNFRSYQNNVVCHYAVKNRVPYVLQAHGSVLPYFAKIQLKKLYDFVWGYEILRGAAKAIALTSTEVNQYIEMGVDENKLELIPNGIDLTQYKNLPSYGGFRNQFNINSNEKIILFLGRIHKIKGLELLVDAFAELLKKIYDCKLLIVGPDDGYLPVLKKQTIDLGIENKVLFTGPLYGKDKLKAYSDADVFVLPAVYDCFSVTLLESMACGTPIVTTNNGDKLDWIHNKAGIVVDYDKAQMCSAIYKILKDDSLRKNFAAEGKRSVREIYNWGNIVEEIIELYEKVL